jgi:hypothetical protein
MSGGQQTSSLKAIKRRVYRAARYVAPPTRRYAPANDDAVGKFAGDVVCRRRHQDKQFKHSKVSRHAHVVSITV